MARATQGSNNVWVIWLSLLVGLVLAVAPMPTFTEIGRPLWLAMLLTYWVLLLPERVGMVTAWLLGLAQDVLYGNLLGQNALILGLITNYLWRDDYHITFTRVVVVFGSWISILFVIWFMANMFDRTAGFERWMKAFNSRARISSKADSVEHVAEALDLAEHYPEVLDYKQAVTAKRELRHEDIRIMTEIGRMKQHSELVGRLNHVGETEHHHDLTLQPAY